MTISEKINLYIGKNYKMEYNTNYKTLTIKEKISVGDFLKIKKIISKINLEIDNIIVEG